MEVDSTIVVALITGGVAVLNVVVSSVTAVISQKKSVKRAEEIAAENDQNERIDELSKRIDGLDKGFETLKNGLQSLLRAEIIRSHEKYMTKGFCPVYAREALSKCYEAYHALGGNGTMTILYNEVMALPTEPKGEHHEN